MFEMRIWERNTTFVGGMLWVCYKNILWFIGVLGPVLKFFTNGIFFKKKISLVFVCFVLFWKERDIKLKKKYIFAPIFNKGELQETNKANLRGAKWYFLNYE